MVIGAGVRVHIAICGYWNRRRRIIIRKRREREKPVNTNLRPSGTNKKESKVLKVYVQGPPPTKKKNTEKTNRWQQQNKFTKKILFGFLNERGRETEKSPVIKMALWLHVPISHLCQTNCLELTLWLHRHICTCKRSKMPNISMFIFQKTLLTEKIFHKNYFVVMMVGEESRLGWLILWHVDLW